MIPVIPAPGSSLPRLLPGSPPHRAVLIRGESLPYGGWDQARFSTLLPCQFSFWGTVRVPLRDTRVNPHLGIWGGCPDWSGSGGRRRKGI